jgi:hypothetical protein
MPIGNGLYGDIARKIKLNTNADLVMLIVLGGSLGSGMSVQSIDPNGVIHLPKMLRDLADQIADEIEDAIEDDPPKPKVWRTEYTEEEEQREYERDLMLRDD